jgi:hypothetical protein
MCNFKVDDNFFSEDFYNNYWQCMVSMWMPQGIKFLGCNFTNNHNKPNAYVPTDGYRRNAIQTGDGQYVVADWGPVSSTFNGFDKAILATGYTAGTGNPVVIQGVRFDANMIGIEFNDTKNYLLSNNHFKIGKFWNNIGGMNFGAVSWYSQEFDITNNYFENKYPVLGNAAEIDEKSGLFLYETGPSNVSVRNNIYSGLYWGNLSQGKNCNASQTTGLNYHCNIFHWCKRDIENDDDIKLIQISDPATGAYIAHNKFSYAGVPTSPYHYINEYHWLQQPGANGGNLVEYNYFPANVPEIPTKYNALTFKIRPLISHPQQQVFY